MIKWFMLLLIEKDTEKGSNASIFTANNKTLLKLWAQDVLLQGQRRPVEAGQGLFTHIVLIGELAG